MVHKVTGALNCSTSYSINDIQVHPLDNLIERSGESFKVSPRAIQVLAYLMDHAGRPVTYHEINDAIWNGGSSENAFYQHIATLRKALGDDSSKPRYIKTIAKQGYVFIGSQALEQAAKIEPQQQRRPVTFFVLLAVGTLLLLSLLAAALWHWSSSAGGDDNQVADGREAIYPLLDLLHSPDHTVVVIRADNDRSVTGLAAVNSAAVALTEHHLQSVVGQHVAVVPAPNATNSDEFTQFYQKLARHYSSINGLSHILVPQVMFVEGDIQISLNLLDPQTLNSQTLFTLQQSRSESGDALRQFEQSLMQHLQAAALVDADSVAQLNQNDGASVDFIQAAQGFYSSGHNRNELERGRHLSQKAIDSNPNNLLAYSLLWVDTLKLMGIYVDYDIETTLRQVRQSNDQALALDDTYHRALMVRADSSCWLSEYQRCAEGLAQALERRAFDPYSLDSLYWNLIDRPDLQRPVAKLNYQLNPFFYGAFPAYRDSLLALGDFHELSELVSYHASWSEPRDWFARAQTGTDLQQLKEFESYYQQHIDAAEMQDQSGQKPSRYIGYSLLNARQPQLARHWSRHGSEQDLPYFDLRVIGLLANIWDNNWQTQIWQVERESVMQRQSDLNALDRLTIAYFDFYSGWLPRSAAMLEQLVPNLLDPGAVINDSNLRMFIYYSEIQKRQGNLKANRQLGQLIKAYLDGREQDGQRGIDFGIADVEFLALNNHREKALELLEKAVYQQGWLPNSLWLWPPLKTNPFLRSLYSEPRFDSVVKHIDSNLAALCFDSECG